MRVERSCGVRSSVSPLEWSVFAGAVFVLWTVLWFLLHVQAGVGDDLATWVTFPAAVTAVAVAARLLHGRRWPMRAWLWDVRRRAGDARTFARLRRSVLRQRRDEISWMYQVALQVRKGNVTAEDLPDGFALRMRELAVYCHVQGWERAERTARWLAEFADEEAR